MSLNTSDSGRKTPPAIQNVAAVVGNSSSTENQLHHRWLRLQLFVSITDAAATARSKSRSRMLLQRHKA
jgi:hypothetical protein